MKDYEIIEENEIIKSFIRLKDNVRFEIGSKVTEFIYSEIWTITELHMHFDKLVVYVQKGRTFTTLYPSLIKLVK